jgi:hypothetical protein
VIGSFAITFYSAANGRNLPFAVDAGSSRSTRRELNLGSS